MRVEARDRARYSLGMDTLKRLNYTSRRFLLALVRHYGPIEAPRVLRRMADELEGLRKWAEALETRGR